MEIRGRKVKGQNARAGKRRARQTGRNKSKEVCGRGKWKNEDKEKNPSFRELFQIRFLDSQLAGCLISVSPAVRTALLLESATETVQTPELREIPTGFYR